MLNQALQSFNGGEITPYLAHLTALDKHASSSARLENFLPMPFGGLRKRPGTLWLAILPAATRLEPFNFSDDQQFLLAFTTTSLRIFEADGTLVDDITTIDPHPAGTPFAAAFADPFALQFAQINDIVLITRPGASLLQLSRQGDDTWTLEEYPWSTPPLLDENLEEAVTIKTSFPQNSGAAAWAAATVYAVGARVQYSGVNYAANAPHTSAASGVNGPPGTGTYTQTIAVSIANRWEYRSITSPLWSQVFIDAVSTVGGAVALESSIDLFLPGHVGAYWSISKKRAAAESSVDLAADNVGLTGIVKYSDPIAIQGGWVFNTYGNWTGTFEVELSRDRGVTWEIIRSYESAQDNNAATSGFEKNRVLMRIKWTWVANGSLTPRGVLGSTSAFITGYVRITAVTDAKHAAAVSITPVEALSSGTQFWAEGAFSDVQGYPAAVGVHDQRVVFAGTGLRPLGIWLSKTDDLRDFAVNSETASDEDGAIFRQLASRQQDPIRWITSGKFLFVGTAAGEWVVGSENTDKPISPTNFVAREHTNYGSAAASALRIGATVIFLERQRRRVRELAYVFEQEQFDAADLTRLAEHITESGIVHWGWQANREPTLWAIRADGVALSFAYNRPEKITAWARHTFLHGKARSVAVLRNTAGDDDVFFVVQRGTVEAPTFHLEKLAPGQQLIQEQDTIEDFHFVDSAVISATTGGTHYVQMPAHYSEGQTVYSLAAGISRTHTLDGLKRIYLPAAEAAVHAGYPITSVHESLPQDIQMENGFSHSLTKKASRLRINLYKSRGGTVTYGGVPRQLVFSNTGEPTDNAPPMFTGWKDCTTPPKDLQDLTFTISHTEPYPFTLRVAVFSWTVTETS